MPLKKAIKISVEDGDDDSIVKKKATPKKKPGKITPRPKVKKKAPLKEVIDLGERKKVTKTRISITSDDNNLPRTKKATTKPVPKTKVVEEKVTPKKRVLDIEEEIAKSDVVKNAISDMPSQVSETNAIIPGEATGETATSDEIPKPRRSIKLYRNIALSFIGLTIVLLAAVFYFTFVSVTIVLVPNQERSSNNMIFDVYDEDNDEKNSASKITGIVRQVEISSENNYEPSGKDVIGEEAVGKVTIFNNYSKNQPLVATTRILSPDSKLFRLKNTVNVPAGGQAEVEIYADEPSPDMAIAPTKFTIPGLWAGLQDKIYAESKEAVVYQQKVKRHITDDDIENSIRDLKKQLLSEAKTEVNSKFSEYGQIIYKIDETSIKSEVDGEINDEVDEFAANMSADIVVVAFNDNDAANLAEQKFVSSLSGSRELMSFDKENIIYTLNNYDYVNGVATINATFEGKVTLKEGTNIVEIDKIVGLSDEQLQTYLNGLPDIAGFEIKYFPSFIKRAPKLVDRITVEIKK